MGGQHTPAPWLLERQTVYALDETGNCNRFSLRVEGGWTWRSSGSIGGSGDRTTADELEANARLIAAAPELLAELEDAMRTLRALGLRGEEFDRKDALIAKAKGQQP